VSKWYLAVGAMERGTIWPLVVLLTGSLLSAAYLGPILYKAYFEESSDAAPHHVVEVPWMVVPLVLTALASLALGLYPNPVLQLAGSVSP
jgi:multicomponent Na+:H+ antiporter subunit D